MAKKEKVISPEDRQWMNENELTNTEEIIRRTVREMSDSFTRAAAEADLQKEMVLRAKELTKMPPKLIKRLAKTYYKASFSRDMQETEEFAKLYERTFEAP